MTALGKTDGLHLIDPPRVFPMIRSEGSAWDVGFNHGRRLGDLVALSVAYYRNRLESLGLDWDGVLRVSGENGDRVRLFDPQIADELAGIAKGAEQDPRAILALNIRTSLARIAQPGAILAENHECTTCAVLPAATADGHVFMLQNWDQKAELQAFTAVFEQHIEGEPAMLYVAEAGRLIQHGLNDAGVGVCGNQITARIPAQMDYAAIGALARRRALRHVSLDGAVRAVIDTPRAISQNHLLADSSGRAIDLEVIPGRVYQVAPEDDILVHSNHFLHPQAQIDFVDAGPVQTPHTLHRAARMREILVPCHGRIGLKDLRGALADHSGHPDGICRHPAESQDELGHTLASTIIDLTSLRLATAPGPACVGTYTEYGFS